jgi:hypothetical protein
MAGAADND